MERPEPVDASDAEPPPEAGPLPEPVQRVSSFLEDAGVEARLHEFGEGTHTAEDAARAVGCSTAQIVKSLIFICDSESVLVMVSGVARADDEKVREATGASAVKIAKPDVVLARTGFPVGGVAPFPLPQVTTAVLDHQLLGHPVVWTGAGSERHVLALTPHDLLKLSRAQPADVSMKSALSS
jgi:prolyl-tRNA editing enzyme YbaK/EbsC (Cys-tRNA(Pro) deacylase)